MTRPAPEKARPRDPRIRGMLRDAEITDGTGLQRLVKNSACPYARECRAGARALSFGGGCSEAAVG